MLESSTVGSLGDCSIGVKTIENPQLNNQGLQLLNMGGRLIMVILFYRTSQTIIILGF